MTRILRFAIAYRLFAEPRPGFVAHSNASKLILEDAGMGDWFYSSVEDMWPAGQRTVDALQKWPAASEPNQTVSILCIDFYNNSQLIVSILGLLFGQQHRWIFL